MKLYVYELTVPVENDGVGILREQVLDTDEDIEIWPKLGVMLSEDLLNYKIRTASEEPMINAGARMLDSYEQRISEWYRNSCDDCYDNDCAVCMR